MNQDMRITAQVEQLSVGLHVQVDRLHPRRIDDEVPDLANGSAFGGDDTPPAGVSMVSVDGVTAEASS